jgi:hypothetical protein
MNIYHPTINDVKLGDFIIVDGEGGAVFVIEKIDVQKERVLVDHGWWEPLAKCHLVGPEHVSEAVVVARYLYDNPFYEEEDEDEAY